MNIESRVIAIVSPDVERHVRNIQIAMKAVNNANHSWSNELLMGGPFVFQGHIVQMAYLPSDALPYLPESWKPIGASQ